MAEETKERLSSALQRRHAARQKARDQLFLKGPVTFNWMCSHTPDAELPHLNWSITMFRNRRTKDDEQATEAGRDCLEVTAS